MALFKSGEPLSLPKPSLADFLGLTYTNGVWGSYVAGVYKSLVITIDVVHTISMQALYMQLWQSYSLLLKIAFMVVLWI